MSEVDRIPVKSLWDSYGVGKTKFYEILDSLGVERAKIGNQAFIDAGGKQRLDRYFNLPEERRESFVRELSVLVSSAHELTANESNISPVKYTPELISQWVELFANAIHPTDRFSNYEQLERFAQNGWLIQSRELKELIGRKALVYPVMRWGGFKLTSVRGRWWRVEKDSP